MDQMRSKASPLSMTWHANVKHDEIFYALDKRLSHSFQPTRHCRSVIDPLRAPASESQDLTRYIISIDLGLNFQTGREMFSINDLWAIQRNRRASETDLAVHEHGDAAFADYTLILSASRTF
jgi:hypothetical protein